MTSHGTMDKADTRAREHLAGMADLIAAIRLPEGSFRAAAGTDVVVDILFFRKRRQTKCRADEVPSAPAWLDLEEVRAADVESDAIRVNEYFVAHPEMVLGGHDLTRGIHGPDETYTCRPIVGADLDDLLAHAIERLPADVYDGEPEPIGEGGDDEPQVHARRAADGCREPSWLENSL